MDPISIGLALAQFAPSLMRLFGVGEKSASAAEAVIGIARSVTGAKTPEEALELIRADAEKQTEFNLRVLEQNAELEKAYLMDMHSARQMQIAALGQEDLFSKRFVYYFAIFWSVFAMLYFCAVTFIDIPAGGQRIADTILGVLITSVVGGMFAYFYGSTKGSQMKTQLMAALKGNSNGAEK